MDTRLDRMRELVENLTEAGKAYYREDREIISNFEYDKLYEELEDLEKETGVTLSGSPTTRVGYESLESLPKERHDSPMLSLDKTKDTEELKDFAGSQKCLLSWKLDGLTVVLTYENGTLEKAVTRGNGEVGEVITNNARVFQNIPLSIPYKGQLILRGEAVISYSDFEKINQEIEDVDAKYKNPRNLCSGSVRQLNNEITASRRVQFYAFALVKADGVDFENSRSRQFRWLMDMGFPVVEHREVTRENLDQAIEYFAGKIQHYDIPSDGLVILYDDIAYGQSLGRTAKFPRDSFAFKWQDEIRETTLVEMEWSPSRTGLINPVAIFEPVELEGTTVSRASVHNISIVKALQLGIGDKIQVYKANMIIPQIAQNLTRSGKLEIPTQCPVCGEPVKIKAENEVETLVCENPQCLVKKIKSFSLLVSRDAMNIDGLSQASLEKFIARGFIKDYADIFRIARYRDEIVTMEGFGEKSYENLIQSIERARTTTLPRFLYGLGIPNIGVANAKMLCKAFHYDLGKIQEATADELAAIDGIGPIIGKAFAGYFAEPGNRERADRLQRELKFETPEMNQIPQVFQGQVFVITGSLETFSNRSELKNFLEERGGKVTGSVTSKTGYLINNDVNSSSSKNKKAKALGIPIVSEADIVGMVDVND